MGRVYPKLTDRGWEVVRSGACTDRQCGALLGAPGAFRARLLLQGAKGDFLRMSALRHAVLNHSAGESISRASDDAVIERAVHLLSVGVWHLHTASDSRVAARQSGGQASNIGPKEAWKRVAGVASPASPWRKELRLKTGLGNCVLVRPADLARGEEYLEKPSTAPFHFTELTQVPHAQRTITELHEAVYSSGTANAPFDIFSLARDLERALREGALVLVRENRGGGGGSVPEDEGTQNQPAKSGAGTGASSSNRDSSTSQKTQEKTWFRMQLLDEDGEPMAGEDYSVVDSAGAKRKGKLDGNGELYIPPILPPGDCTISFPNVHLNPRKRK